MVNKQKQKGTRWENDLVDLLNEKITEGNAKRIPSSGAIGTILKEPILTGDVVAKYPGLSKKIKFDAKVGYGSDVSLRVQREWLTKIRMEAEQDYSHPALACKFSGARVKDGVQYFIVLDIDTFCAIINHMNDLWGMVEEEIVTT